MGSIHLFRYSQAATLLLCCCFSAFSQTDTLKRSRVRIGYAESDETVMSGKADMVTEEKMNKGLVKNSLDALSGRAAGVSITKGNSAAMLNTVRVRGTTSLTGGNDPLVIIDGVSSDLATLNTIYPADIESFTILKDASETDQYGSRGASGVIEVQTKKGNGGVFRISYDGTFGFESAYKFLPMLDGKGYRRAAAVQGISILDRGYDTNFQKEISRTGTVQNHHIAFG
ncbi:MAG: TonB-dependent receptor plug domain-containing protein, partial [Bacteroidales bacterium]|nr:TonB-dependent receptor plug domain-containing protein [Bacteroidales bacterium]